jgi:hypothetical protein
VKLAGAAQAEVIKIVALCLGGYLLYSYARGQVSGLATTLSDLGKKIVNTDNGQLTVLGSTVWDANNMVSGNQMGKPVPDYTGVRDTTPLDNYFQTYGNTAATRASAKAAGWTDAEISLSVMYLSSLNS